MALEILYFDKLESTQKYLTDAIRAGSLKTPICVVAKTQTNGIGSKDNKWDGFEDNLFFSFALDLDFLPKDLPRQSICIYLLYVFKECLANLGSKAKIKWPNDIYIDNKKICGAMTAIVKKSIICGIGLNSSFAPEQYGIIDIQVDKTTLLLDYLEALKQAPAWGVIFSKYEVEFSSQKENFFGDLLNQGQSVELQSDGSLIIDGTKVFGVR